MNRDQVALAPVATIADETLIRFVIYTGPDEYDRPEFDDFSVGRKDAASILRKHHRDHAHIERRMPKNAYDLDALGDFYIEPCDDVVNGLVQAGQR